jgi:hypothetical protein
VKRPEPGVDAIRALRAGLKILGPDAAPRRLRRALRLQRIGVGQRGVLGFRDRSLRQHDHFRPDLHAVVQVDHVLVCQTNAPARHVPADRGGRVRAMDAILRTGDIHRTRAERISGAAGGHARQIRLARNHLGRWIPVRPLGLALDRFHARPGETFAADTDAGRPGASRRACRVCKGSFL